MEQIVRAINEFEKGCQNGDYTYRDKVWELLYWIRAEARTTTQDPETRA